MSLWKTHPRAAASIAAGALALYVGGAALAVDPFDVAFERFHRTETLVWREESAQTTVAIHDRPEATPPMRVMYLDGNHQANDSPATAFIHHRIGALPTMLHQRPATALVVGLGGGATPGAVARLNVDVDVVELSGAVVEGSHYFKNINFDLLSRPNVRLHVDDGRNFLLMNRKKYDVITADIILPRHAGAGSLYSREYYELVRRSLADGGLVDAVERRRLGDRIQTADADVHVGVPPHHVVGRWQPDAGQHEALHAQQNRLRSPPHDVRAVSVGSRDAETHLRRRAR